MPKLDLTPFGFTPTESLTYNALLEFGPSSGYALAKKLNIARANAYQALNGLVTKLVATTVDGGPQRYRATRPDAVLARLINAEAGKLDKLEQQVRVTGRPEGPALVPIFGRRALVDTALRTAAREGGPVTCVGPAEVLAALGPAWRRREADGLESVVYAIGDSGHVPISLAGRLDGDHDLDEAFGGWVFLLAAGDTVVVASGGESEAGYWASERTMVGIVRTALAVVAAKARAPQG